MKINRNSFAKNILAFIILAGLTLSLGSCKKDEPIDETNEENEAFYGLMTDWYFWYNQMPQINPSQYANPADVLEALRYEPLDRWSYVTSKAAFDAYFIESKMIGYGFGSAWDQGGKLRVIFIFNSTDMYLQGVRRGWIIEAINGTAPTPGSNINQLLGANQVGVSNTFRFRKPDNTTVELSIQKKEVIMNTVLHHEVIESNGNKIAYLVLNGFTTPTAEELNLAFDSFIAAGVNEMILDLRYNGGGQTNVAAKLAAMIAGPEVVGQPFAKYVYNDKKGSEFNKTDLFSTTDKQLNLERLITICTKATASASEMVINGLRPFMPVQIVGDNTYGKPMGMNAWYYGNLYAFVPITFKLTNAENFGDYFDGLPVNFAAQDDITRPFGDPEEASLEQALALINFGVTKSQPVTRVPYKQPREYMTGLRALSGMH